MTATLSDGALRRVARARVCFRQHLAAYVLLNLFMAALRYFTSGPGAYYWPVWVHLGWGVALAFSAWEAYGARPDAVAREEERLRARLGRP